MSRHVPYIPISTDALVSIRVDNSSRFDTAVTVSSVAVHLLLAGVEVSGSSVSGVVDTADGQQWWAQIPASLTLTEGVIYCLEVTVVSVVVDGLGGSSNKTTVGRYTLPANYLEL